MKRMGRSGNSVVLGAVCLGLSAVSAMGIDSPVLVSPINGLTVAERRPTFTWSPLAGQTLVNIVIERDGNVVRDWWHRTTESQVTLAMMSLADGLYHWKVRAEDAQHSPSEWSAVANFTVDGPDGALPPAPVPRTPAQGATLTSPVDFSWSAVSGATGYTIEYNPTGQNPHAYGGSVDASYAGFTNHNQDLGAESYQWRVRCWNQYGDGDWSAWVSFTVGAVTASLTAGATDLGGGWWDSPWLGMFCDAGGSWIYHNEHRWMYYQLADGLSSIWFYVFEPGVWWWTGNTAYPWLWRASDAAWLYYYKGLGTSPRTFWNGSTQQAEWQW